jgi:hypothetical protein
MKESKAEEDVISDTWANRYIPTVKILCCNDCPLFQDIGEDVGGWSGDIYYVCIHPVNNQKDKVDVHEWFLTNNENKNVDIHKKERHPQCPIGPAGLLLLPTNPTKERFHEDE